MTEFVLSLRFSLLLITLSAPIFCEQRRGPPHSINGDKIKLYAERVINVHQPVYQPGYGNFNYIKPLHLTPAPPVVMENTIAEPTPIYNSREVKIKNRFNIIDYPMQFSNPFNYYSNARAYNPYAGPTNPMNVNHPMNMLYGPLPYQPISPLGLPFRSEGQNPKLSHGTFINKEGALSYGLKAETLPQEKTARSLAAKTQVVNKGTGQTPDASITAAQAQSGNQLINEGVFRIVPQDRIVTGNFWPDGLGFGPISTGEYYPYSAANGPFGPNSAYSISQERQLIGDHTGPI